jgi:hypothetical protein
MLELISLGVHAIAGRVCGRDHQLADAAGVPETELEGHAATEAVTMDVGFLDADVRQQRGGVVGERLVGERTIDVRRMPVSLELDRDDPAGLGQGRHEVAQQFDGHVRTGQHEQRISGAVDLERRVEHRVGHAAHLSASVNCSSPIVLPPESTNHADRATPTSATPSTVCGALEAADGRRPGFRHGPGRVPNRVRPCGVITHRWHGLTAP